MSTLKIAVRHRQAADSIRRKQPGVEVVDLTSRGPQPWVKFSPFYPHGRIPVPGSPGRFAASVEGLWQALKVFERADVDERTLDNTTMKGIKRTTAKFGRVLGHRDGLHGTRLLGYLEARREIYLPAYGLVLARDLTSELEELRRLASGPAGVVLLDYETNTDVDDLSSPLSHAGLVMRWLQDDWPASARAAVTSAS